VYKRLGTWALLGSVVALVGAARPVQAAFAFTSRTSAYTLSFTKGDFSDANAHYDVTINGTSNNGDSGALTLNLKSNHQNFSLAGTGSWSVSSIVETPTLATATLTASGSTGGYNFHYDTPVQSFFSSAGFGNSWLAREGVNGFWGLRFGGPFGSRGGGAGLVDVGASFAVDIVIPGDWSNLGTGPGQTQLINVNPTYTIDSNFVYDPISMTTDFHIHTDSYLGNTTAGNPQIDFILHSTQIAPEPSSVVLAALGVTGLVCSVRRRRRPDAR
jgi:hypothetical protein